MKPGVFLEQNAQTPEHGPWQITTWRHGLPSEFRKHGPRLLTAIKKDLKHLIIKIEYDKWDTTEQARWDRAISHFPEKKNGKKPNSRYPADQELNRIYNGTSRGYAQGMWIMVLLLSHEYKIPVPEEMTSHPELGEATKHFMRVYMRLTV